MEVRAVAKNSGVSPHKVGLMVDMVRGKKVEEALTMLRFTPSPTARLLTKVIQSAVANAEKSSPVSAADLKIVKIYADGARTLKRFRPKSRGRVGTVLKRYSHIIVIVAEEES